MAEQSAGLGIPGFETGNYSSLPVKFRMEIAQSYFAPNAESRDPDMIQLQWRGPVSNVVYEDPNEDPMTEGHVIYSCGKKERSFDQGATITREGGGTKVDQSSFYGRLLDRLAKLNWQGQPLLQVLRSQGGGARKAASYEGLVLDCEREEITFGTDRQGNQIVAVRMMPVAVVAVPGAGLGAGPGAGPVGIDRASELLRQNYAPSQEAPVFAQQVPDQNGYHWNGVAWEPIHVLQPIPVPLPAPIPPAPAAQPAAPVPPAPAPAVAPPPPPAAPGALQQPQTPQNMNGLDSATYNALREVARQIAAKGEANPEYAFLDYCYRTYPGNEEVTKRAMDLSFFATLVS